MWKSKSLTYILASIWIIVKLSLFYTGNSISEFKIGITLNFGFILFLAINSLLYFYKSKEGQTADFTRDFTLGLKVSMRYVLIIFCYLIVHYNIIEPDTKEELLVSHRIEQIEELGGYESYLKKNIEQYITQNEIESSREDYPVSLNDFLENERTGAKSVPNLFFITLILLLLFLLCVFVSALSAALLKKLIPNKKSE
jgi:hypothetical protein|tara:strand:+ start:456 stop:1049 length:594 start_codon:yes stop_codon:yes gene_type:complete